MKLTPTTLFNEIEEMRIEGFSKTLAQIEWLLAAIVAFYLTAVRPEYSIFLWSITVIYAVYVFIFHYTKWTLSDHKVRLISTTVVMLLYITVAVWLTGKIGSPLVSLYYLAIVVAAVTLDMKTAFIEVFFITLACLVMAFFADTSLGLSSFNPSLFLIQLFPFWLVAYLTSMLAKEVFNAKQKLEHLSQTDGLTGLWNMRMFSIMADREFLRVSRTGKPFSIVMLDADNLKPVNDVHGHQAGSKLIWHMAKMIKSNLRVTDLVARYGGDEFVLLLSETEPAYGHMVAERIRTTVENTPLVLENGETVKVTMSLGIASYPRDDETIQGVMSKADEALYASKRNGKNRCTVYTPEEELKNKKMDEE